MEQTFDLTTALANDIVGQKRTGKNKQFVFLHGDYAIKGPYQQSRINNVLTRSQIFAAWNTPCVVMAIDYFNTKDGTFVRFPNIMTGYQLEYEPYAEAFSGLQYKILKNPPVTDIGHALMTNPWIATEAENLLLALCHCNILGVGDMNLRNTLVNPAKHQFYIIDFDDNLGKDRDDGTFYFNKSPGKKLMWCERVAHHYNKVANRLMPLLNDNTVTTNGLGPRVERAIGLLQQFAPLCPTLITADTGTIQKKVTRAKKSKQAAILQILGPATQTKVICVKVDNIRPKYNNLKEWTEDPNNVYIGRKSVVFITDANGNRVRFPPEDSPWANPFKIEGNATREAVIKQYRNYILSKIQNGVISLESLEKLRGKILGCWCKEGGQDIPCHGDIILELLELNRQGLLKTPIDESIQSKTATQLAPIVAYHTSNIGRMVWKGLRGGASKTYSGVDFDIAKSALQKYIRRNMPQKAILAAIELFRFGEIGGDSGVTNMYNRLSIIASEDIGPANLPLALEVTRIVEDGDRDVARLITMVQLMANGNKTRIMSHAWRAYANPEGREVSIKMGLPVDTTFTESDLTYITENYKCDLFIEGDPETIRPYILVFLKRLYEKDFNAFSWAYFFLEIAKEMTLGKRKKFVQGNPRSTTGKADILLWKALSKILPSETHDILVGAYYNHTENRPFLQNSIIIALYGLPYNKLDIEPSVNVWRQQPSLQQMLNGDFILEIDPYVIDKHTAKGRTMGKNINDFVAEGAIVDPQDPQFHSDILETIYMTR